MTLSSARSNDASSTDESVPRWLLLAHDALDPHAGKTAMALLRYRPEIVVGAIDRSRAGSTTGEAVGLGGSTPVFESVASALERLASTPPNRLLLGTAPPGGALPPAWRAELRYALENGVDVWSGLHTQLSDDSELVELAGRHGRQLVDLRAVPDDLGTPTGERDKATGTVVLTVGSDCNIGKMTASWEIAQRARERGLDARFVATGQTGVLLADAGLAIDRVISDFTAGAADRLVGEAASAEWVFVEGQGSLTHPYYSAVTLGLLHGTRPDAMILCHSVERTEVRHCPGRPIRPLPELVELYERAAGWVDAAPVIGVALATFSLRDDEAAERAIEAAHRQTGLPAEDVVRFPSGALLDACLAFEDQRRSAAG